MCKVINDIKVSILCTTYNHGDYIKDCLDSLLAQKTNFAFEIVINDDASTDNTSLIIEEYVKKFPKKIHCITQKENLYKSKGLPEIMSNILLKNSTGKYIAFCEGDDYWTDSYKLQLQYDAMENNDDCTLCVHRANMVDGISTESINTWPKNALNTQKICSKDFIKEYFKDTYWFHWTSYFVRKKDLINYYKEREKFSKWKAYEDQAYLLYFGLIGNVYYIDRIMSVYRFQVPNSWSSNNIISESKIKHMEEDIESYKLFNVYTNNKYSRYIFERINYKELETGCIAIRYVLSNKKKYKRYKKYKKYIAKLNFKFKFYAFIEIYFPLFLQKYKQIK